MSSLHRRLAVSASVEGLHLRPYSDDADYAGSGVRIRWGGAKPEAVDFKEEAEHVLVVDGCAGVLQGPGKRANPSLFADAHDLADMDWPSTDSFIILVVDPIVSATLMDSRASKILSVDGLVSLPLSDFDSASAAIAKFTAKQANTRRRRAASVSTAGTATGDETDDSDSTSGTDDERTDGGDTGTETEADARPPSIKPSPKRPFWQKPFSRSAPKTPSGVSQSVEGASTLETSTAAPLDPPATSAADMSSMPLPELAAAATQASPIDPEGERAAVELDEKVLLELLRTMRGMYFSHDNNDITRSLQHKHEIVTAASKDKRESGGLVEPNPTLPLWRRADRRFFWNAHLQAPFIEAGVSCVADAPPPPAELTNCTSSFTPTCSSFNKVSERRGGFRPVA